MYLFSKNLEHIIGASYLSGAAEALIKSKSLSSDELERDLEELKDVRRTLLNKAESDGHKRPVHIIEEAKLVAYKILKNEISTTNEHKNKLFEDADTENMPDSVTRNSNMNSSNVAKNSSNVAKNSSNVAKNSTTGLMPLDNKSTTNSATTLPTKNPPPVLQLGGRRSKKSKKSKSKSRKHRK